MFNNPQQENEKQGPNPLDRSRLQGCSSGTLVWIMLGIALLLWVWNPFGGNGDATQISYSAFRQQLKDGNVEQVTVTGQEIRGGLKEPAQKQVAEEEPVKYDKFVTYLPSFGDDELLALLEEQGVEVTTEPESDFSWWTILFNFLPFALIIGFGYLLFSRMRSQGQSIFSVGRSRAKLYDREQERTTFDDVAGARGPKTELREIIEFLKSPERFQSLGGEIPTGVLLVGPPGTGKTLLARAVAGEAQVPFFSITGSDFMEMFVGVGASRVRSMFSEAKKASPSIIFIDELDSIGRRRGAGLGGGHDEREQTLNQLLSEMDGFEPNEGVIVMAATNRPDILDPALLRPGRFDRRITVDLPTMQDRFKVMEIHARNKPLADDVDLERIARGTPGFSGADLENLLNEAALLAARKDKEAIEQTDIDQARDKILLGLERDSLALTEEECKLLAYHEAGHALTAAVLPKADPIHKVTIVPRGRSMGVTQQLPERDKYIYQREYMLDRMAVMMGGRAAEDLVFQTVTSGAENDLKQATQLARKMVLDWGMSAKFKHMALGGRREQVFLGEEIAQRREYSETTAREVDEEIKTILSGAYEKAVATLQEHRDALDRLATVLLEQEEIPGERVLELVGVGS
jgi:cell division protease FtsH